LRAFGSRLRLEARAGTRMTRARQARKRRDADADLDLTVRAGRDPQPASERAWETSAGGTRGVRADGVRARSGSRGGGRAPGSMTGENRLPRSDRDEREQREKRHQLDRRLAGLAGGSPAQAGGEGEGEFAA
jgi:hypothetical protein